MRYRQDRQDRPYRYPLSVHCQRRAVLCGDITVFMHSFHQVTLKQRLYDFSICFL